MKKIFTLVALIATLNVSAKDKTLKGIEANNAVKGAEQVVYKDYSNNPTTIKLSKGKEIASAETENWLKNIYKLDNNSVLKSYQTESDKFGFTHTRYNEFYKGYKVEASMFLTHEKNGKTYLVSGNIFSPLNVNTNASLSEKQALAKAMAHVNAQNYMWQDKNGKADLKSEFYPKAELVIVSEEGKNYNLNSFKLAYKFNIYAQKPLSRAYVYVDAHTGKIVADQNLILHADVTAIANTKYSGVQTITVDSVSANSYRLRETGRGNGIQTYNMGNTTNYTNTDFTNTNTNWNVTGPDKAATDAHFGAERTYDYFFTKYNRNSINNAGFILRSYVHYDVNYVNAFWDGSRMTYGDGATNQGFDIMTALDVCGHEITHGLTNFTANLGSNSGTEESDGLNEGFSDIFGTSIEAFARPTQNDWIMGIDISTNGQGIRDLQDPHSLQNPSTYQGQYWDNAGEPHTNSCPLGHWFYLLSMGGSGTTESNQPYSVTSITMNEAEAIAYRTLTTYLTSTANYTDTYNASIQATTDLYGACSNEMVAVINAWFAVGVGNPTPPVFNVDFLTQGTTYCTVPVQVDFINTSLFAQNFTWDFGDGTTDTLSNPTHTFNAIGSYTITLHGDGCNSNTDSVIKTSYINISVVPPPTANGTNICTANSVTLTANNVVGQPQWFSDAAAVNMVDTVASITTPVLGQTTTYYVRNADVYQPIHGGPANNSIGTGSNFNSVGRYLIFDAMDHVLLKTVKVVAQGAGNRTVELRDASDNVILSKVINIAAGTSVITLNFDIQPGQNYHLGLNDNSGHNLYRNTAGATFPYNIGGLVSITNTNAGTPGYYYYFYDWVIEKAGCHSALVPVTVTFGGPQIAVSGNTLIASSGSNYQWFLNGVAISGATSQTYQATTSGVYSVSETIGACSGMSADVQFTWSGINSVNTNALGIIVLPNPASNNVIVKFENKQEAVQLAVYDIIGKVVFQTQIEAAVSQQNINISSWSTGVYTIKAMGNSLQSVTKFVKE